MVMPLEADSQLVGGLLIRQWLVAMAYSQKVGFISVWQKVRRFACLLADGKKQCMPAGPGDWLNYLSTLLVNLQDELVIQ